MSTRSRKSKQGGVTTQQQSTSTSRTTATASTSAAETSQASTPSRQSASFTSPRSGRPPSPSVVSRQQEKHELASLNDRLANYIDKVRSLELENSKLTSIVQTHEETTIREVTNVKNLYENELNDARKAVDETAKEKTKLALENEKYATEIKSLRDRNAYLERDLKDTKKHKLSLDSQVNDLQARLSDAVNQRKHWEGEFNRIRHELDDLKKQYAILQQQHEEETTHRVDLQNRIQSLKEDYAFRSSLHEKELEEVRTRVRTEIEETDGLISQQDYNNLLQQALMEMREENDFKIQQAREETEDLFNAKLAHFKDVAGKNDRAADLAKRELTAARRRIDELSTQVTGLSSENASYVSRLAQLEGRLAQLENLRAKEQEEAAAVLAGRDAEIQRLRDALEDQMSEYRDLLDIKIQLDNEISSYRRMIESEETRLNISAESTPGRSFRRTPVRSLGTKKRKRDDIGSTFLQQEERYGYAQKASATGEVEVYETNTDGRYVKLYNKGEKDQSLGGWQVKHTAADQDTVFKFHRSTMLKAGQHVTVWSSDTGETHNPPTDLVMKGQRWFTAESMSTELINPQGDVMASRELTKTILRTSQLRYSGSSSSDASALEGDPQERCAIM